MEFWLASDKSMEEGGGMEERTCLELGMNKSGGRPGPIVVSSSFLGGEHGALLNSSNNTPAE